MADEEKEDLTYFTEELGLTEEQISRFRELFHMKSKDWPIDFRKNMTRVMQSLGYVVIGYQHINFNGRTQLLPNPQINVDKMPIDFWHKQIAEYIKSGQDQETRS